MFDTFKSFFSSKSNVNDVLDIHKNIRKSVIRSQHCQRNWDLDRPVPQADIDLMIHAATQCPSKQNNAFYSLGVVQDRNIIEQIHENTFGLDCSTNNKKSLPTVKCWQMFCLCSPELIQVIVY